jgi:hypothetical protein
MKVFQGRHPVWFDLVRCRAVVLFVRVSVKQNKIKKKKKRRNDWVEATQRDRKSIDCVGCGVAVRTSGWRRGRLLLCAGGEQERVGPVVMGLV